VRRKSLVLNHSHADDIKRISSSELVSRLVLSKVLTQIKIRTAIMSNPNRISPVMPKMISNDSVICDFHHGLCLKFQTCFIVSLRLPLRQVGDRPGLFKKTNWPTVDISLLSNFPWLFRKLHQKNYPYLNLFATFDALELNPIAL